MIYTFAPSIMIHIIFISYSSLVHRENNFPPVIARLGCKPCFYHDISVDIPVEFQKTCKMMFYLWQCKLRYSDI